ncbi:uracil-DNA glycosylase [Calidithermus chliarophilus]|uniref:uracil-DNA glycosylase n=1 Tax=Calidithermus chliarophilus TaxID=52023 RepID=UPI00042325FE|nr:uracil-DNA glycosylase [Calidithermus chliarophilus]
MNLLEQIPPPWKPVLREEFDKPYMDKLEAFLEAERAQHQVFPPQEDVFNALRYTPYDEVRVLVVGQDPYHDEGQAHGLAFSVRPGVRPPPSLLNIFRELEADLGIPRPKTGYLKRWAEQGVLLLNTSLTVRAHEPASHKGKGWEQFTDAVIRAVSAKAEPVVFVLWGAHAQKKLGLIDARRHSVIQSAHPSPLSAKNGFFGSRPFSKINAALRAAGRGEIDWRLEA